MDDRKTYCQVIVSAHRKRGLFKCCSIPYLHDDKRIRPQIKTIILISECGLGVYSSDVSSVLTWSIQFTVKRRVCFQLFTS